MRLLNLTLLFVLFNLSSYAQNMKEADRFFRKSAYKKAIKSYKKLYNKRDKSYKVISRIADSYYFIRDVHNSEKWFNYLAKNYPKEFKQKHIFRFAQSLKGNGKYHLAYKKIKKLANNNSTDKMVKYFLKKPYFYKELQKQSYKIKSFKNLKINTKYSDFGAAVYKNNFYYSSSKPSVYKDLYEWNEQAFLNLYVSKIKNSFKGEAKEVLYLKRPKLLSKPIRTKFHESNVAITKDGMTMYFTRDNFYKKTKRTDKKKVRLKLFKASLVDGIWKNIEVLPFNRDTYSCGHPCLSADDKILYFTSDKPGGFGGPDIYSVTINKNGSFSDPKNLGKSINTEAKEMFPFVSDDNTLYFSSNGHLGLGGLDIFESEIVDGNYSVIQNLKEPFNSSLDDFCFYIDKNNRKGFISSNRKGGKGDDDIYAFILDRPKRRDDYSCNKKINGVVLDKKTKEIISNAKVTIYDNGDNLLKSLISDSIGEFTYQITCKSEIYKIKAEKELYIEDIAQVTSDKLENITTLKLELTPIIIKNKTPKINKNELSVFMKPVYFDYKKTAIRDGDSRPNLDKIIRIMKKYPKIVISIDSHTDSRSSYSYNLRLSQERADNSKAYMISKGIKHSRIANAKGYGETELLNDCGDYKKCTEKQHQLNRRSYFKITGGDTSIIKIVNTAPKIIDSK